MTHILRNEKKKMKNNFSQQLTASLAHEQLNPLNTIVNVTSLLQKSLQDDILSQKYGDPNKVPASRASTVENQQNLLRTISADQLKFYEYSTVVWSSAQMMQYMILSQMSLMKLNMKMLMVTFEKPPKPVTDMVIEFMEPFYHLLKTKRLTTEVIEINEIPSWANTDWNLFKEILFHIV